ncbi:hypothetical protein LPJ78_002476 [Coemansia sp. RSA 989]|nr:hypothetical protein LPJ68_001792 [Coemansia sp. RSA 1086]KAJ1751265.1 hypothetical protein LPJ79_002217 [Coemansia sp. RSA 1821]KAJ1865696.1 hypothetical protein LPJ78_002476 [Coemansia sp. RSA 989]KAJ1872917.1 hypothetical protein LPJ55_002717 [Coemansia sp. RSA 990]KAJ2672096.1 hypothetical protein IWW42_003001 [Coemansia sp. RSA 1085]
MVSLNKRKISSGWRLPIRADSLSQSKATHHIVHSSIQDGLDKLNDYLQAEEQHRRESMEIERKRSMSNTESIIALYQRESSKSRSASSNMGSMTLGDSELLDAVSMLLPETPSSGNTHMELESGSKDQQLDLITGERDQLQILLDECITTSEQLVQQHEAEQRELIAELERADQTAERLHGELSESQSNYDALLNEHRETLHKAGNLASENQRLQELVKTLQNDVAVAEQRNQRIKQHAEATVSKANAEISRLQEQLAVARKETSGMQDHIRRAELRAHKMHSKLTPYKKRSLAFNK